MAEPFFYIKVTILPNYSIYCKSINYVNFTKYKTLIFNKLYPNCHIAKLSLLKWQYIIIFFITLIIKYLYIIIILYYYYLYMIR
jgi:hypothetical protein